MSQTTLTATARREHGSRAVRRLRREGRVPAILYGHDQPNETVSLDARQLARALDTPAQVFSIEIDGVAVPALVKEVQYETYGKHVVHVDLMRVDLSQEVEVEVHLEFLGTPKGLSEGGSFETRTVTVRVACRADAIPDKITVDISGLGVGDHLSASDIVVPEGVRVVDDAHEAICGVVETRVAALETPAEAAPAAGEAAAGGEGGAEDKAPAED